MSVLPAHPVSTGQQGHTGHDTMHSGHDGGGDATMGQCSMSMVWNTATSGMCIVFSSWQVRGPSSLLATLVILFVMAAVLELLRLRIRRMDVQLLGRHAVGAAGLISPSHRRKASVQQVLGHSNGHTHQHYSPSKSSGIGGSTLISGLTNGDRRVSPLHTPSPDFSSRRNEDDGSSLLPGGGSGRARRGVSLAARLTDAFVPPLLISQRNQVQRATLYVVTLSLSMFLMLVFMTYNAWLIAAVLAGAGTGHYLFNRDANLVTSSEDRTGGCH